MASEFQSQVKRTAQEMLIDRVVCKRDGSVEIMRGYFYRFGMTADAFANAVQNRLESAGINCQVHGEDRFAAWPRDSWFVAVVRE